jgi:hypothetical protein
MKNMFKSNTVRVLTILGTILLAIHGMEDALLTNKIISEQDLEYVKIALIILETLLGVKFRLDAENKTPLIKR